MDEIILYDKLKLLKAYKADRVDLADLTVRNHLLNALINYCKPKSGVSHQACWVLEQVFLLHEQKCLPQLEILIALYKMPINHSDMRSLLKIAYLICKQFYRKKISPYDEILSKDMRETLVHGCFNELITARGKSANLIFATRALFFLGQDFPWVHDQLPEAVNKHLDNPQNKGYRNGAIAILKKLE